MSSVSGSGERILAILDLFSEARPEWQPEEMMAALGYSRPTLYRYLKTLKDAGFVVSSHSGFTLGPRVTELDFLMHRADPLIRAGQPRIDALAAAYPGSAFLVRWYGQKLLCVASAVSAESPRSSYPRGRPMPLGRGAISRAIVAFLPARERRELVRDYLAEFIGAGVGGTFDSVIEALKEVRRDGTAVARGEVTPGVLGVAAPIFGSEPQPIGAVCLSNEERRTDEARLGAIREAVKAAAQEIDSALASDSGAVRVA